MKQKDIIIILTFTCIVAVAWIIFTIYHISVTTTISDTLFNEITPINPTFNQKVIDELKNRENTTPLYELKVATPTANSSSTVAASGSGSQLSL